MAQRGQVAHSHMCSLMTIDHQRRLVAVTVNCLCPPSDGATCKTMLDSRRYDSSGALPLDHELEPTPAPRQ